ncbi:MAG TPA: YkgJ family cysteine cluster protein [Candidatus Bathyarchaeia archaeon]|nr:YkgJ family cysteine cluster protein [Candidatus Bathyarchaeia archaeon]
MRCLRCGLCCRETEMLLANADIERLERKGYSKQFFARFDREGYAKLRNQQGYCVFYDVEKRRCKVHADRPLGCRIYPVVYDEAKGIVVDDVCHAQSTVTEKQKAKRGKKVLKLLEKIDAEAKKRRA